MRSRTLLLPAAVLTLLPVGVAALGDAPPGRPPAAPAAPVVVGRQSPGADALDVLRRWDARRARAWARGDPQALAAAYVEGSRTGRRDVADLRRWTRRGLRVTGLREQVIAVRVVDRSADRLVVVVTDRTVDGVAVGGGGRRTAVPRSAWATQRVVLVRGDGRWRVAEAQPAR